MVKDDTNLSQADRKHFSSLNIFAQQNWSLNVWPAALMVKWVAKAGLLCEVLLSPLYNHLYYQIKYKMTAHNKVVTADTVSWPLPIITWDISKRINDKSSVLFCHQSYSVWSVDWCVFSFSGCHHQYFVSPEARDVGEEAGGGGPVMTKSHPWHSPSHSWHPTHSSNPPDLHTPLLTPPASDLYRIKSLINHWKYASRARLYGLVICERVQRMFCSQPFSLWLSVLTSLRKVITRNCYDKNIYTTVTTFSQESWAFTSLTLLPSGPEWFSYC